MNAPGPVSGAPEQTPQLGPWNPGITSTLPRRLYPLVTIFNPMNAAMPVAEIEELARFSGLSMQSIVELKPERLVLHELLVRVTAELSVDDGPHQRDLGANFRRSVSVLERHTAPRMAELLEVFDRTRAEIVRCVEAEAMRLDVVGASGPPRTEAMPLWRRLLGAKAPVSPPRQADGEAQQARHELLILDRWYAASQDAASAFRAACCAALHKAASAVQSRQGSIAGRRTAISRIAVALAVNDIAGERIGAALMPIFLDAVKKEGLRRLPSQGCPVVMNTKGASAAGKSTLRPRQHALADRIGAKWQDFAIISPDIWRKQLLDYGALGPARRWAGTLAAYEVEIIDRKLDRYVSARAHAGRRTHMLIDRFRFDSFAPEGAEDHATQLLTRFGSEVYMYFMVTPPEATVERAWWRGEVVGRYKAVDDLLAHNVEAYSGMPLLFFRWAASADKQVHFEFLDNSVAEGETPRTIACGQNGSLVVADLDKLLDIDRYRTINIAAARPQEVYCVERTPGEELTFVRECIRKVPSVQFAAFRTGDVYAAFEDGRITHWNEPVFQAAVYDPAARTFLIDAASRAGLPAVPAEPQRIDPGRFRTLGAWCEG